jgi:hypothetical protein
MKPECHTVVQTARYTIPNETIPGRASTYATFGVWSGDLKRLPPAPATQQGRHPLLKPLAGFRIEYLRFGHIHLETALRAHGHSILRPNARNRGRRAEGEDQHCIRPGRFNQINSALESKRCTEPASKRLLARLFRA